MNDLYSNINVLLHKTLNGIYYTIGYEVTAEHCYQDFLVRSRHCINLCYVLDVQLGSFRAQARAAYPQLLSGLGYYYLVVLRILVALRGY